MKQEEFQKLLEGNIIGSSSKPNIDQILKQIKEATEQDRSSFFNQILGSTRYDVMEALVDLKSLNQTELSHIALKCKLDDLPAGIDTDSIPNKVHKEALSQLHKDQIPKFYSDLVDSIFYYRKNKMALPSTETL